MRISTRPLAFTLTSICVATLVACGGGDGGGSKPGDNTDPQPPATRTIQSPKTIDGVLKNAKVCLDMNANGQCDEGEPYGTTDATGVAHVEVEQGDDTSKYPWLAEVGSDAVDADTGPVKTAYRLTAPAGETAVVSPLTTLVQTQIATTGSSREDAIAAVKEQLGINASDLMADYTSGTTNTQKAAGTLARLLVVTTQKLSEKAKAANVTDSDGKALSAAQIDSAVQSIVLEQSQTLAVAAQDNHLTSATDSNIDTIANNVAEANYTAVPATADAQKSNNASTPAPEVGGSAFALLRWFSYTDTNNYYLRTLHATKEQNTADANGTRRYTEKRETVVNGQEKTWVRPQIYWTGTEWFDCPADFVQESITTSAGQQSLYCQSLRSSIGQQTVRDISGLKIRDTLSEIRSRPWTATDGKFADWGPKPELIPAAATWPTGSQLQTRAVTDLGGTMYYMRNLPATIPPADDPLSRINWRQATLDQFIAWNAGDFSPKVSAADVHGNNSRVLITRRDYQKLDGSLGYKRYMVGLEAGGERSARFYECEGDVRTLPQASTLFINNVSTCKVLMVSNYTIATQGDAKVLSFAAQPLQLQKDNVLFVERNGVTYEGFRTKTQTNYQQRLNQAAAEALLATVGLN